MNTVTLNHREAMEFARFGIPAPPRVVLPDGFDIGSNGVPVEPVPRGRAAEEEIRRRREDLPLWYHIAPRYRADSDWWSRCFTKERQRKLGLSHRQMLQIPPEARNRNLRARFWARPGLTVTSVITESRHEQGVYTNTDEEEAEQVAVQGGGEGGRLHYYQLDDDEDED